MPTSCSAFGCTNRRKTGGNVQFFGFPLKNNELLKKWITSIRRKDFKPTKASKICSDHFNESDYLVRPGTYVKHLKPDAVPSVFTSFLKHLKQKPSKRRILKRRTEYVDFQLPMEIDSLSAGTSTTSNQLIVDGVSTIEEQIIILGKLDKKVQTEENLIEKQLKRKIKTLQQKVRRQRKNITSLKDMLKMLKKKGLLQQDSEHLLMQHFQGTALEIFKNETKNFGKRAKGYRYSKELKKFALTLHYCSPKAYSFCRLVL